MTRAWRRLIGVATHAHLHENVDNLKTLNPNVLDEIEVFFEQYNRMEGKQFRPTDRVGPKQARKLIEDGQAKFGKK
jgi:inorganic pyrophosphatase